MLQKLGTDTLGFDGKWTYMSTHHFYEPSAGTWRLEVSDMVNEAVGFVRGATLEIRGMPIVDTDRDALDDEWERSHFGNLANAATDDPDLDGYTNIREWIQGLDPELNDSVLDVIVSKWNDDYVRLNWPARNGVTYEVLGSSDLGGTFQPLAFVTGGFPRVAWFAPLNTGLRFFRVREVAD